jgi:hypothetical protein
MARTTQAFEDKIKRAIRDGFAYDPLLTQSALVDHLNERFNHSFDPRYIKRLTNKVMGQARAEIDRATIEPRLSALRETHRISRETLLDILQRGRSLGPGKNRPWDSTLVEAARNLVMLDIAVLNAEVANGLYKNVEEAAVAGSIRYPALPSEQRQHIVSAFQKWGMLPPGTVEHLVVEQITTAHATRVITVSQ